MAPPLREAASQPGADHPLEDMRYRLDYADPTGETAIRNLLDGGGPFTITAQNGFHALVNKETLEHMMRDVTPRRARPKKNRAGRMREGLLWLHPTKKNNPTAVEFGDENSGGAHTNTTN